MTRRRTPAPLGPDAFGRRRGGRIEGPGGYRPDPPLVADRLVGLRPEFIPDARPLIAVSRVWRGDCSPSRWFGDPPMPAGRECQLCPTILSRWNPDPICGPCQREARAIYPPLEFDVPSVVYYGQQGERIKIGTSTQVDERCRELKVTLLATEPGSYAEEAERHKRFAHLRIKGEWFRPGPDLLAHIATLTEVAA